MYRVGYEKDTLQTIRGNVMTQKRGIIPTKNKKKKHPPPRPGKPPPGLGPPPDECGVIKQKQKTPKKKKTPQNGSLGRITTL